MNITTLPINLIRADESISPRNSTDAATVETYRDCLDLLPAVVVFVTAPGHYLLADGFHRYKAHVAEGREEIKVEIRKGSRDDAEVYALTANNRHGRPLTREERRLSVERMLKLHPERSDSWIGEDIGAGNNTVRAVREGLEASLAIAKLATLIGRDGKKYPRNAPHPARQPEPEPEEQPDDSEADTEVDAQPRTNPGGFAPLTGDDVSVVSGDKPERPMKPEPKAKPSKKSAASSAEKPPSEKKRCPRCGCTCKSDAQI